MAPHSTISDLPLVTSSGYDIEGHSYSCDDAKASTNGPIAPKVSGPAAKKRSVTFFRRVAIRNTIHIMDYTDEEMDSAFYCYEEIKAMRSDAKYVGALLRDGLLEQDTEEMCRRGVEHRTREGALRKYKHKSLTRQAVLEEQDIQWEEGVRDPELIASVYQSTGSTSAASFARAAALKDELDAMM